MAGTGNLMKFVEGDKIKFKHYSNISPYPICIGTVDHVYGPSLMQLVSHQYTMDVIIDKVISPEWAKDLEGSKVRVNVYPDTEKNGDIQKLG